LVKRILAISAILTLITISAYSQNVKLGTGVKVAGASSSGAVTNITGDVTPTGCTVSAGVCTVGTATSPVSFASIPGTYNKILIDIVARLSDSALNQDLTGTVNSDTGTNYYKEYLYANNVTIAGGPGTGLTGWTTLCRMTGATADANVAGSCQVSLLRYAGTTFYKNIYATSSVFPTLATVSTFYRISYSGLWASTSAITSISFADSGGGNINVGSTFIIYGVK
jgi:hypothetical protein